MNFSFALTAVFLILSCTSTRSEGLVIVNGSDPGKCNQTIHGKDVLVQDRENNEIIIFCTGKDGVYKWANIGGKTLIGERFSPAYDCSKILDNNPTAKDGMYWIDLGENDPKQAYCDMTTDGGGYMLFGKIDTSVTWTVPSSNNAVEPYGNPHWASNLGEAPILDLRIQIGKMEDLSKSLAHWSFRLKTKRLLKNLMIADHGCAQATPGIGNIAYVKDLQTEKIVTTKFRCSVFGGYHDPTTGFGWNMMNSCLKKPCRRGFAFLDHDVITLQTDHSGSFSYSVSGTISGIFQNSTAFVGCDKKKCCGCFGPAGGTDDYCGTDCKNRKNGSNMKNIYSWFWVRSSIPKKMWNKCMDYKVTTPSGDTIRYKLLDGKPTPEKGRCGRNQALLNDGVVVVPDEKIGEEVPAVPGLLKYQKDTNELYVRANESWCVVAQEKKLSKVFKSDVGQLKAGLDSDIANIQTRFKVNITQLKRENAELKTNISKLKADKTRLEDDVAAMKKVIDNIDVNLRALLTIGDAVFTYSRILFGQHENFGVLIKSWIGKPFIPKMCWRATRDGWGARTFHSKCDYKKPTVTLIKVGKYIFGGYATESWDRSLGYRTAPGPFIFSLCNKQNLPPFKSPLKYQKWGYAVYAHAGYGPTFGKGYDIHISSNAASNTNSFTRFDSTYQAPFGVSNPRTILAGTYSFTPSEIEIFHIV